MDAISKCSLQSTQAGRCKLSPGKKNPDVGDMGDLKHELRKLHCFPVCMQELLHNDNSLADWTALEAAMDLQLVLLSPSRVQSSW